VAAGEAELAVITVQCGFERGAHTTRPAADTGSHLDYRAGGFVAQHHRVDARCVPDTALGIRVQIAAADADSADVDLYLAGCGIGYRLFGKL
jgi:hypothetical protein